jgi:hypothetical protein
MEVSHLTALFGVEFNSVDREVDCARPAMISERGKPAWQEIEFRYGAFFSSQDHGGWKSLELAIFKT